MKITYINFILLGCLNFLCGQHQQIAHVQSLGANIANNNGIYISSIVVGEALSGQVTNGNFQGSTFGFLNNESFQSGTPPVADAGSDWDVNSGEMVQLDGSASSDADNDNLSYSWTSLDGVNLSNANTATPSFTAPSVTAVQVFRFELRVNDGQNTSPPDEVEVKVYHPEWRPVVYTNNASLIGRVTIDAINAQEGDVVGAYVNNENRGIGIVFMVGGQAYVSMNIQAENSATVTFRVYDTSEDMVCMAENSLSIVPGNEYGDPGNPIPIDATCGADCAGLASSITHNNSSLASGTYQAQNTITSSAFINNAHVTYIAGQSILLNNNFEVTLGSSFTAMMQTCNTLQETVEMRNEETWTSQKSIDLKIQPNPFSGKTTLIFDFPKSEIISVSVVDIYGHQVLRLAEQQLFTAGMQELPLDARQLQSGFYFVVLQTKEQWLSQKIVLNR